MASNMDRACPFCSISSKGLENHLPFCSKREGRDYSHYLSQKTTNNRVTMKKQLCQHCGKWMKRLDTHLRLSACCKRVSPTGISCMSQYLGAHSQLTTGDSQVDDPMTDTTRCSTEANHHTSSQLLAATPPPTVPKQTTNGFKLTSMWPQWWYLQSCLHLL